MTKQNIPLLDAAKIDFSESIVIGFSIVDFITKIIITIDFDLEENSKYEITIKKPFNILEFTNKGSDQAGEPFHYTIDLLKISESEIRITTFSQEKIIIGISNESVIEILKITE